MTGVSTSSTPRWARNSRTAALSRARRRSASNVAEGCQSLIGSDRGKTVFGIHTRLSVFGEESQQPGLVPDLDVAFLGLGQIAAGGLPRDRQSTRLHSSH